MLALSAALNNFVSSRRQSRLKTSSSTKQPVAFTKRKFYIFLQFRKFVAFQLPSSSLGYCFHPVLLCLFCFASNVSVLLGNGHVTSHRLCLLFDILIFIEIALECHKMSTNTPLNLVPFSEITLFTLDIFVTMASMTSRSLFHIKLAFNICLYGIFVTCHARSGRSKTPYILKIFLFFRYFLRIAIFLTYSL